MTSLTTNCGHSNSNSACSYNDYCRDHHRAENTNKDQHQHQARRRTRNYITPLSRALYIINKGVMTTIEHKEERSKSNKGQQNHSNKRKTASNSLFVLRQRRQHLVSPPFWLSSWLSLLSVLVLCVCCCVSNAANSVITNNDHQTLQRGLLSADSTEIEKKSENETIVEMTVAATPSELSGDSVTEAEVEMEEGGAMNAMASFIHDEINAITEPSPTANEKTTAASLYVENTTISESGAEAIEHDEVEDASMAAMAAFIQDEFPDIKDTQDSATTSTTNTSIQNNENTSDVITFANGEQEEMVDTIILDKLPAGTPSNFNILDFVDDMSVTSTTLNNTTKNEEPIDFTPVIEDLHQQEPVMKNATAESTILLDPISELAEEANPIISATLPPNTEITASNAVNEPLPPVVDTAAVTEQPAVSNEEVMNEKDAATADVSTITDMSGDNNNDTTDSNIVHDVDGQSESNNTASASALLDDSTIMNQNYDGENNAADKNVDDSTNGKATQDDDGKHSTSAPPLNATTGPITTTPTSSPTGRSNINTKNTTAALSPMQEDFTPWYQKIEQEDDKYTENLLSKIMDPNSILYDVTLGFIFSASITSLLICTYCFCAHVFCNFISVMCCPDPKRSIGRSTNKRNKRGGSGIAGLEGDGKGLFMKIRPVDSDSDNDTYSDNDSTDNTDDHLDAEYGLRNRYDDDEFVHRVREATSLPKKSRRNGGPKSSNSRSSSRRSSWTDVDAADEENHIELMEQENVTMPTPTKKKSDVLLDIEMMERNIVKSMEQDLFV